MKGLTRGVASAPSRVSRVVAAFAGGQSLEDPLSHGVDGVDGDLGDFPPQVVVLLHTLLGAVDVVGEIVVAKVFAEVVQTVKHVGALP